MCKHVCDCACRDVCDVYFYGLFSWLCIGWGNVDMEVSSVSQLRLNRWRKRECEQKVSNMEELIVFLIVSLQFFCFISVSFGQGQALPCVWYKMACLPKTSQNGWESSSGRETGSHEWTHCARDAPHCCAVLLCRKRLSPMLLLSHFLLTFCPTYVWVTHISEIFLSLCCRFIIIYFNKL